MKSSIPRMIQALRLFFPAEDDIVLRDFIRYLDADKKIYL